jgi:hypothetical protein
MEIEKAVEKWKMVLRVRFQPPSFLAGRSILGMGRRWNTE